MDIKKKQMIEALTKGLGVVTSACKSVGIVRQTHYNWYQDDPEYRKEVDDVLNVTLDFVESKLFSLIRDGNPSAIFYYLNNKGTDRGYSNKQHIDHSNQDGTLRPTITVLSEKGKNELDKI